MINEIDILHERHCCDFACHAGEKTAGLFCVVSYHHKIVIKPGEHRFDSFTEPFDEQSIFLWLFLSSSTNVIWSIFWGNTPAPADLYAYSILYSFSMFRSGFLVSSSLPYLSRTFTEVISSQGTSDGSSFTVNSAGAEASLISFSSLDPIPQKRN